MDGSAEINFAKKQLYGPLSGVSSRNITEQTWKRHFCINESWQREENKGLTDKFEVLKLNLTISHHAPRKLHPVPRKLHLRTPTSRKIAKHLLVESFIRLGTKGIGFLKIQSSTVQSLTKKQGEVTRL